MGLVYALADNTWPTSERYTGMICVKARERLTQTHLERAAIAEGIRHPSLVPGNRAKLLSLALQHRWGIRGLVNEIPMVPRWAINATAYESGRSWRFMPNRMGDYELQYVIDPPILLADALAASAAYPFYIGPLKVRTADYDWHRYVEGSRSEMEPHVQTYDTLHLWDGGIYDNVGVEPLFKIRGDRFRDEYNFLIVSDASGPFGNQQPSWLHTRALRLLGIAREQVRSLRARTLVDHFDRHPGTGIYLQIGKTRVAILKGATAAGGANVSGDEHDLSKADVAAVAAMRTRLHRLTETAFDLAYRHGWEVAHYTLAAYRPDLRVR